MAGFFSTRQRQQEGTALPESGRAKEILYNMGNMSMANAVDFPLLMAGAIRQSTMADDAQLTDLDRWIMANKEKSGKIIESDPVGSMITPGVDMLLPLGKFGSAAAKFAAMSPIGKSSIGAFRTALEHTDDMQALWNQVYHSAFGSDDVRENFANMIVRAAKLNSEGGVIMPTGPYMRRSAYNEGSIWGELPDVTAEGYNWHSPLYQRHGDGTVSLPIYGNPKASPLFKDLYRDDVTNRGRELGRVDPDLGPLDTLEETTQHVMPDVGSAPSIGPRITEEQLQKILEAKHVPIMYLHGSPKGFTGFDSGVSRAAVGTHFGGITEANMPIFTPLNERILQQGTKEIESGSLIPLRHESSQVYGVTLPQGNRISMPDRFHEDPMSYIDELRRRNIFDYEDATATAKLADYYTKHKGLDANKAYSRAMSNRLYSKYGINAIEYGNDAEGPLSSLVRNSVMFLDQAEMPQPRNPITAMYNKNKKHARDMLAGTIPLYALGRMFKNEEQQ
jgi:hypothetical protein